MGEREQVDESPQSPVPASPTDKRDAANGDQAEFDLRVADDSMSVLLDCTVPEDDLAPLLTRIESELSSLRIVGAPSREELEQRLRRAAENGPRLVGEVLVEGQRPVAPQHGEIEWAQDFFSSDFAVDEKTGSVDYRQRVARVTVQKGQLLARVTPAKEGRDGCDVFGRPIPVGRANEALIHEGPNVRHEEEEGACCHYATEDGRIRWASGILAVDNVYTIQGNVGLKTGHISHPGALVIQGDVEADSKVQADGDIEVKGTIEAADVQAGGNLTVGRGIIGAEGRKITVGGSIRAKFILEAHVEAGEEVVVDREITHSILKTRGIVTVPRGRLVGGQVTALGGVVVGQAGSDGLVRTLLIPGQDYRLAAELAARDKQITVHMRNLKKIHEAVDPLMAEEKALAPKQREAATELLANAGEMETAVEDLRKEKKEFEADSRARTKPYVLIKEKLYPETIFRFEKESLRVAEEHSGPVHAVLVGKEMVLQPGE